jgi:hypothetical protein
MELAAVLSSVAILELHRQRTKRRTATPKALGKEAYCSVLPGEPLWGQDKWLGGEMSPCGQYIYGVPGTAKRVLRITVKTGKVDFIGPSYEGKFKWLRAVVAPFDGCIYCLPINAKSVLKINPVTQEVTTIGGPFEGDWKWHGGCVGADGCK